MGETVVRVLRWVLTGLALGLPACRTGELGEGWGGRTAAERFVW